MGRPRRVIALCRCPSNERKSRNERGRSGARSLAPLIGVRLPMGASASMKATISPSKPRSTISPFTRAPTRGPLPLLSSCLSEARPASVVGRTDRCPASYVTSFIQFLLRMCSPFHCFDDLYVTSTTAQVSAQSHFDLLICWMRVLLQKCFSGQDHSRRAIPALEGMFFFKCLLNQVISSQSFNSGDFAALSIRSQKDARRDWFAIDKGGTGSTYPDTACRPHAS